ncbi:MAG: hypothetical protein ISP83_04020 [Candidatus Poseidonia sp.]|nr:hypothetical protein [Poseidonia sp.]MBL6807013.1 hypothetical protein [Poseidonia sp.]MBL6886321.1 hypothetical protein [Poseidonia sp.]MBL6892704.1 hypothetical protein [Poseidonia sp.]
MRSRAAADARQQRRAVFLVAVLCAALIPLAAPLASADGARDASIQVTPIPSALEVNPGESGEYTIRVRNTGSNPVTVSLATTEEATAECNAYTSTITQITGLIDAGSYEEAAMNITLTQAAEGTCDTTVTVTANEQATPPDVAGAPAQEAVTVTTTAGDGSGSAIFGVDIIINNNEKTWGGEEEIDYLVEVENTGQTNETINLVVDESSGPGCGSASEFTVTLSETSVNIDQDESETVTATVEVPEGQSADKYCWEVTGTVANDPSQEAKDTEDFELNVPELKECEVELSKTSITVNPDAESTVVATYANAGNADWTVTASAVGSKASWVQVDGASSGLLPYNNGNGERSFDFTVSPDDSVTAGTETVITIAGKEGSTVKCQTNLRVIVGQSYGASISVATSLLSNIEPGSNKSTSITVTNQGNGPDNLRIASSSAPTGWAVQLEQSTVSVGSRHGNDKSTSIDITVRVPENALATEQIELTFSVLPSSGGTAYDSTTLSVSVAAVHAMDVNVPATDQTGRSGTEVRFPIDIVNDGNVRDTISLSVVSQTANPSWGTSFENEDGMPFSEIEVDPQRTTTVYLVVSVDGEEELENSQVTVRIRNKDDPNSQDKNGDGIPDNQREAVFLAVLSDRNFSMDLRFEATDTATTASIILPPSGEQTLGMWIRNTGDGEDEAVFTIGGLEGIATRSITAYGLPVTGELTVPKGYGIWDIGNATFVLDPTTNTPYLGADVNAADQKRIDNGLIDGYEAKAFEVYLEMTIRVNPGAETGQSGLLEVLATSVSNAANRSGLVTLSLEVSIIHDIEFIEAGSRQEVDITYGEAAVSTEISIVNTGNVRTEIRIFTSENLRGWSVVLDSDNTDCKNEGSELMCTLDEGERLYVNVTVRAPYGAEIDDLYKFTLSAEPTETGVLDRQNIEFAAQGSAPDGVISLANNTTVQAVAAGMLLLLALVAIIRKR